MDTWQHLVAFPSVTWDFNWERQHELIVRLAAITPGQVFVHQPYGLINYSAAGVWRKYQSRQLPQNQPQIFQNPRHPKMQFANPLFIPRHYNKFFDAVNAKIITRATPVPLATCLVYATYANGAVLKILPKAKFSILDLAQRRQAIPELGAAAKHTEREAVKIANVVFADNHATRQDYAGDRAAIHYLPQGVDVTRFQNAPPIALLHDWKQHFSVVAGYAGSDLAIDYPLLLQTIAQNPATGFLLVGAFDRPEAQSLQTFKNVLCTGRIAYQNLASYYAVMDVGLVPYQLTERIKGVFPTKFFEYLAAGMPVVSTALPDLLPFEGPLLQIWQPATSQRFTLPSGELRKAAENLAAANSWDARFAYLKSHLPPTIK